MSTIRLPDDQLAQLADLIADRIAAPHERRGDAADLMDASSLAAALGVSRDWVYEHAQELGVLRLGDGERPRLRFDLVTARESMRCLASKRSEGENPSADGSSAVSARSTSRRLPSGLPKLSEILAKESQ